MSSFRIPTDTVVKFIVVFVFHVFNGMLYCSLLNLKIDFNLKD